MRNNLSTWLLFTATILFFTACGGGGSDTEVNVENNNSGTLTLSMLDAPADDYNAIYVTIRNIRVHEKGGRWRHVASPHATCNLLELVGGLRQHLGIVDLDEGEYNQLRIILGETPDDGINILSETHPHANYLIDTSNDYHPLKVPSGFTSGIKVIHKFHINGNETTDLVLDFDASQSIVKAGGSGKYLLKPVIRVLTENDASRGKWTIRQEERSQTQRSAPRSTILPRQIRGTGSGSSHPPCRTRPVITRSSCSRERTISWLSRRG